MRALVVSLALTLLLALAFGASAAQAATDTVEFSCSGVTYHFTGFPNATNNTVTERIVLDGKSTYRFFHFNGPEATDFFPFAVPPGHHSYDAFAKWKTNGVHGARDIKDPHGITCEVNPNFKVEKLQKVTGSFSTETLPSQHVGQTVEYEIIVTNTGNVPLKMFEFSDPKCEGIGGGPGGTALAPGESTVYTCHHLLTKADGEAGEYCNVASVTASDPITKESNTVCVELPEKSEFGQKASCKSITFFFFGFPKTNGNTVHEFIVSDGKQIYEGTFVFNGSSGSNTVEINLPPGHHSLDARASWNTNGVKGGADHKIAGGVNCTGGGAGLTIEKLQQVGRSGFTKSELTAKVGETVSYEIIATNTGETTLTLSNFSDSGCSNVSGGASTLEAGKSTTWLCEHKLTEGGKYNNSASVEANEGVGKKESNKVTVNVEQVPGTCEPSSSLAVLIFGKDVLSYVPKGSWEEGATGVSAVNVEGSAITPVKIETKETVNSCASNSVTGVTVCTANGTDVYIIKGTKIEHELTSGGSSTIRFSGGSCTNCGVSMDSAHNRALIGLSVEGKPSFQFLNLETLAFEKPFAAASGAISEDPLIDPSRELILSPTEGPSVSGAGDYELINVTKASEPAFFTNPIEGTHYLDSAGEDCSTGIALSTSEGTNLLYLADLTQAKFTSGSPGSWSAPSQFESLEEATELGAGTSGVAVAQGTHTGIVAGEFGGNQIVAIAMPETSGTGTPALRDYVSCHISGFSQGKDPHTTTAYKSPNSGDAIGLVGNEGASTLVKVDLTKMLNPSIVKRTAGGHACESGTLPEEVASAISVP